MHHSTATDMIKNIKRNATGIDFYYLDGNFLQSVNTTENYNQKLVDKQNFPIKIN